MVGYDVLTFVEHSLVCFGKVIDDVLHPRIACADKASAIEIDLTDVVVGIDKEKVLLQILLGYGKAYILCLTITD